MRRVPTTVSTVEASFAAKQVPWITPRLTKRRPSAQPIENHRR